jgi:hypothetical protein
MGTSVSQAAPLGDAFFQAASATEAFIAEISWRPLFVGVLIGGRWPAMTSRFGDSRVPKYGGFSACPGKGMRFREGGRCDDQNLLPRGE